MIPDHVRPWLEAALNEQTRPLHTMADVERSIREGVSFLKLGERSAIVISVTDEGSAGERLADVWLAGGNIGELKQAIPHLAVWARDRMGCTQAVVNGRKGWVRALAPFGFEYVSTSVRKLLR